MKSRSALRLVLLLMGCQLKQSLRSILDRHRDMPLVLFVPVALVGGWYVTTSHLLQRSDPAVAAQATYTTTLVLLFLGTALAARSGMGSPGPFKGTTALPIPPGAVLMIQTSVLATGAVAFGTILSLPVTTAVLEPGGLHANQRLLVHTMTLFTWLTASLLGAAWSLWSGFLVEGWLGRLTAPLRALLHLLLLPLGAMGLATLPAMTGGAFAPGPLKLLGYSSAFPVLELAGLPVALVALVWLTHTRWHAAAPAAPEVLVVPWVPGVKGAFLASAQVTALRIVRQPTIWGIPLCVPLTLMVAAGVARALSWPGVSTAPIVAVSAFIIPASLGTLSLATDLFTMRQHWLTALPFQPARLVIGELLFPLVAVALCSAPFVLVTVWLAGAHVVDPLGMILLLTFKTISLSGVSLILTGVIPAAIEKPVPGNTLLLGALFALGTGLVEAVSYALALVLPSIPEWLTAGILAAVMCAAGISIRYLAARRRVRGGGVPC